MRSTVTAIDFGTSKVVTLIANPRDTGINDCDVVGVGSVKYEGYINGQWIAPEELYTAIKDSMDAAQKQAGLKQKITEVFVGVPGEFSEIRVFNVKLEIQGADPRVTSEHIDEIFTIAEENFNRVAAREMNPNNTMVKNVVVHRSPAWFIVDGEKKTLEPVGLKAREISALVCFVTTSLVFTNHMNYVLNELGYKVVGYFSSLMGQTRLYIPEAERDNMAVLVDVGYLGTDVVICEGDAILFQEKIAIGGGHLAVALASGLNIPMNEQLEDLKRRYQFKVFAGQGVDYQIQSQDSTQINHYTQEELDVHILPVVDELCTKINEAILSSGCNLSADNKIYLTGGGLAKNKGSKDYMQSKLSRPVVDLPNVTIKLTEPYFSSAMGLLDIIITDSQLNHTDSGIGGFFKKLFSI
ncbi:MAG: hypothetical protein SPL05_01915 [Eubacteriales bacterium]|nr:hypothetical protein [Eubacteriales bacterium]